MMRTANPALNDSVFTNARGQVAGNGVMTLEGTVNKTILSVAITTVVACLTFANPGLANYFMLYWIGGLILGLVISFKPAMAPTLTPVYAGVQGMAMGGLSLFFESRYPGIVFQAVGLTLGVLFTLLTVYKSGWIKPTENFKLGVVAATGGVFIFSLIAMVLGMLGVNVSFLHDSSPLSIGISLGIVILAALNLVLDFDFIENGAASRSMPKHMEWYAAFGLLVTLIWLYVEMLRLLAKLQSRD